MDYTRDERDTRDRRALLTHQSLLAGTNGPPKSNVSGGVKMGGNGRFEIPRGVAGLERRSSDLGSVNGSEHSIYTTFRPCHVTILSDPVTVTV